MASEDEFLHKEKSIRFNDQIGRGWFQSQWIERECRLGSLFQKGSYKEKFGNPQDIPKCTEEEEVLTRGQQKIKWLPKVNKQTQPFRSSAVPAGVR